MTCALCGDASATVAPREFRWAGQSRVLEVCSFCADKANVTLARTEKRAWLHTSPTDVDVKPYVTPNLNGAEAARRQRVRNEIAAGRPRHISPIPSRTPYPKRSNGT